MSKAGDTVILDTEEFPQSEPPSLYVNTIYSEGQLRNKSYRVIHLLGKGSFGVVELVETDDGKLYALKNIKERKGKVTRENINKEIRAWQKISAFPNCRAYLACYIDHEWHYDTCKIFMEYISGKNLTEYLEGANLSTKEILMFSIYLARAVKTMHDVRIAHNDIKPDNIMLNKVDMKLVDYGLACDVDRKLAYACGRGGMGTAKYMSPAKALFIVHSGDKLTSAQLLDSDIWALGCVIYTMSEKDHFYTGESFVEIYHNISEGHHSQFDKTPEILRPIITKMSIEYGNQISRPTIDQVLKLLEDELAKL